MAKLERNSQPLTNNHNPFFETEEKKPVQELCDQTIKVPLSTHAKVSAIKNIDNVFIWQVIDRAVSEYAEKFDGQEKAMYEMLVKKNIESKKEKTSNN